MSLTSGARLIASTAARSQRVTAIRKPLVARHRALQVCRSFSASRQTLAKKYTEDHEWIELEEGNVGKIGISEYAAKALGDVVYVELPQPTEVAKGDTIGAVESVKSASDIMTPVAGKVLEGNSALEEKPATINQSPEGDGWIAKIEVTSQEELAELMDKDKYDKFTGEQEENKE